MGVVAGQFLARAGLRLRRNVRVQSNFFWCVHGAIPRRGGFVGIVRRAPSQPEQKRLGGVGARLQVLLRVTRLGNGIVTLPLQLLRPVGVVEGIVVSVRAFQNLPVVEALPALGRDERRAAAATVNV